MNSTTIIAPVGKLSEWFYVKCVIDNMYYTTCASLIAIAILDTLRKLNVIDYVVYSVCTSEIEKYHYKYNIKNFCKYQADKIGVNEEKLTYLTNLKNKLSGMLLLTAVWYVQARCIGGCQELYGEPI